MINNAVLAGRLTKNVMVRYTNSGTAVGNFTLAVERRFTKKDGERESDFINCVVWGKTAETLQRFAVRGSLISVEGSIQTGSYEKDGRTIYTTEVNVQNFSLLESKEINEKRRKKAGMSSETNSGMSRGADSKNGSGGRKSGFNGGLENESYENPFENVDINDDDYPF